jgi:hypothetical protein
VVWSIRDGNNPIGLSLFALENKKKLPEKLARRKAYQDSGKDSGQKPRRSLQERLFHAGVIPKCCSNGSGARLGLRE